MRRGAPVALVPVHTTACMTDIHACVTYCFSVSSSLFFRRLDVSRTAAPDPNHSLLPSNNPQTSR